MIDTSTFLAVTAVYLIIITYLGYLGYKRTKKAEDFLVCGRKIHPVVLALSYGATFISTSAIVGFGGVAGQLGMGILWLTVLTVGVGVFVAFVIYGKRIREIGKRVSAVTFPDLMGRIYQSDKVKVSTSLIILIGMPLYTAAILIGGAHFLVATLNMDYNLALLIFALIVALYVVGGGLIAVMYTDAMQGGIMLIGMIALLVLTYSLLGGVTSANQQLTDMAPLVPAGLAAGGMTGWTSMPELGSGIWWTLISTIVLCVGIGVLAQPQLSVRFMTVSNNKALNRGVLIGGLFVLITLISAFTVGALTNVYFFNSTGQLAIDAAEGNADAIIPLFIASSMPDLFVIVFTLALLAAAMSTLSSLFHTLGTAAGHDLWSLYIARRGRHPSSRETKRASQIGTIIMIVISVALSYMMPGNIIARATAMFMGLCACALLPAITYALYCKAPYSKAALASILSGAISWAIWTLFVHARDSTDIGLSELLFGMPALLGAPWSVMNPIVIGLPLSTLILIGMHLWNKQRAIEPVVLPEAP